jgi:hypothetical protein
MPTAYLISDRDRQDVLSLVPLAIQSSPPSQQPLLVKSVLQAGWGCQENPLTDSPASWYQRRFKGVLEFLSPDQTTCWAELRETRLTHFQPSATTLPLMLRFSELTAIPERHLWITDNEGTCKQISLPNITVDSGQEVELFAADDGSTYYDFHLTHLAQSGPERTVHQVPVLVYHCEGQPVDIESPRDFLRRYCETVPNVSITHIGPRTSGLLDSAILPALNRQVDTLFDHLIETLQADADNRVNTIILANDGDYRTGLMAATLASLRHGLLFFVGKQDRKKKHQAIKAHLAGRPILFAGDVDSDVKSFFNAAGAPSYSYESLAQAYIDETLTQKIIVVNPDDTNPDSFDIKEENLRLSSGPTPVRSFFSHTSLAAPFLAAAKHQLILPIASTNPTAIDQAVDEQVMRMANQWNVQAHYLTIVASPDAVPMAMAAGLRSSDDDEVWIELDNRHYGSVARDEAEIDLAVGRIFGPTISDCSTYVARVLFYDQLRRNDPNARSALLVMIEDRELTTSHAASHHLTFDLQRLDQVPDLRTRLRNRYFTRRVARQFDRATVYLGNHFCSENQNLPCDINEKVERKRRAELRDQFKKAALILICGDADQTGYSPAIATFRHYDDKMWLNLPVIVGIGCRTAAFEWLRREQLRRRTGQTLADVPADYKLTNLFAAQNLRRGAIGQQCSVDVAYFNAESGTLLHGLYVEGLSLGEAFRRAKNAEYQRLSPELSSLINHTEGKIRGDAQYVLIGDPTFVPQPLTTIRRTL